MIVEREPEWDEETVKRAEALLAYEAMICGGCGNPVDETADKRSHWIVHDEVCMACRAKATVERDYEKAHENDQHVKGKPMSHDGRRFYALPHKPEEVSSNGP